MSVLEAYQLPFFVGETKLTALCQGGFFRPGPITRDFHRHLYPEVHVLAEGEADFLIGNETKPFRAGDCFVVPAGVFHHCVRQDEKTRHLAFQALLPGGNQMRFLPDLARGLEQAVRDGATARISSYLAVIVSELFFQKKSDALLPVQDRDFLLDEFFSHCYQPGLTLAHLAKVLHLSEKQAARWVQRSYGCSFREKLCRVRLEAAEKLQSAGTPREKAASLVGYRTASALWKAKKRIGN